MYARLYTAPWNRTGRDRTVLSMTAIRDALASYATSDARTDFRYIKKGTIKLPGVASSQDYRATYLIYSNDDVHYFGAWIDSIEWSSAESFAVSFTDDYFNTFAFGATVQGQRLRKIDLLTWNEAVGDFPYNETRIDKIYGVRLSEDGDNPVIVYINAEITPAEFYRSRGVMWSPFVTIVLLDQADRNRFRELINTSWWSADIVIAAYAVPSDFLEGISQWGSVTFSSTYSFKAVQNQGLYSKTVDMFSNITGNQRIVLNSHDSKLQIRLGKNVVNVPFEALNSGNVTVEFALTPNPVISFKPDWNTSSAAYSPKYAFSDFPQISFTENAFGQWAIKNALPAVGSGVVGGFASGGPLGALAGGISSAAGSLIGYGLNNPTPDATSGATSSIDAVAGASAAVQLVVPKDISRVTRFYGEFGYPCFHRETYALNTLNRRWDFLQATDNVITGSMPQAAKDEIDAAVKSGVRIWNTVNIGDYT